MLYHAEMCIQVSGFKTRINSANQLREEWTVF